MAKPSPECCPVISNLNFNCLHPACPTLVVILPLPCPTCCHPPFSLSPCLPASPPLAASPFAVFVCYNFPHLSLSLFAIILLPILVGEKVGQLHSHVYPSSLPHSAPSTLPPTCVRLCVWVSGSESALALALLSHLGLLLHLHVAFTLRFLFPVIFTILLIFMHRTTHHLPVQSSSTTSRGWPRGGQGVASSGLLVGSRGLPSFV